MGQVWCYTPLVPTHGRQRQVISSLLYIVSSMPAKATEWDSQKGFSVSIYLHAGAHKGQKRSLGPLELELSWFQHLTGSVNCCAISPVPLLLCLCGEKYSQCMHYFKELSLGHSVWKHPNIISILYLHVVPQKCQWINSQKTIWFSLVSLIDPGYVVLVFPRSTLFEKIVPLFFLSYRCNRKNFFF